MVQLINHTLVVEKQAGFRLMEGELNILLLSYFIHSTKVYRKASAVPFKGNPSTCPLKADVLYSKDLEH